MDNGSSVHILLGVTYDNMLVDHERPPRPFHYTNSLTTALFQNEKTTLVVEMRVCPQMARHYMDFLMIDNRSAYHEVVEKPSLRNYSHHLYTSPMHEVPTEHGIASGANEKFKGFLYKNLDVFSCMETGLA